MNSQVIRPTEGDTIEIGGVGIRFLTRGEDTGGRFALVEHPLAPRALAAPVHTHDREDEYSYVLDGRVGVLIGDQEHQLTAGDFVLKPRGVPHTFWNAGDEPARVLELISPGGFERYFEDAAPLLPPAVAEPRFAELAAVQARYALQMDFASVAELLGRHGLQL
ncbi:MAG: cupin domain-containing protein [Micromonosporaceae bacterium]